MTFTLSRQQDEAVAAVLDWFTIRQKPVFRLFGYAGSGKTSLAKTIAKHIEEKTQKGVVFAAYTGKAANVLRSKGCNASTIHGLIYKPKKKDAKVQFILQGHALRGGRVALIIIDECSMVDERIGLDLLSFGVPVLVLGDPAQLPPIGGGGYFTSGEPDVMLTEIHRQRDGCGIIDIATAIRTGQRIVPGAYSESCVLPMSETSRVDPFAFDQVICGKNDTRSYWNRKMRAAQGRTSTLPEPGDKLICLRNQHQFGIVNGEQAVALGVSKDDGYKFELIFDRGNGPETCIASRHYFDGKPGNPEWTGDAVLYFDFGYAITCHKSQGSQWPRVLVVNESRCFRDDAARWLYTAVTRASEHVTVLG